MNRQLSAVKSLLLLRHFLNDTTVSILYDIYIAISPDMPTDLESTPVPSPIPDAPDAPILHFNYDEGHAGRFSVPHTEGASLPFDWVMSQPHPSYFILSNLLYRGITADPASDPPPSELVIFSPGLNTLHQPVPGELYSYGSLIHYINTLGPYPMALLHTGTSLDQRGIVLDAPTSEPLRKLISLLPEIVRPTETEDGELVWSAGLIDVMQTSLSLFNLWSTPLKAHFIKLFETTKDPNATPFVLMVYSRASVECDAALRKHIDESKEDESMEDIQERLRRKVTIVTIGSASSLFSDGPAYIHVASWYDSLSRTIGVTGNRTEGGGEGAVYLNCGTPFNERCFDNHNFGSLTAQFLSIVMALNGVAGFRELWEKGGEGELVVPDSMDGLVTAMIVLTDGRQWLWDPEEAMKGVEEERFPDREEAEACLREGVGDDFVDRVLASFPQG